MLENRHENSTQESGYIIYINSTIRSIIFEFNDINQLKTTEI